MKLDHLEVEIEGGLLLLLPAEVPLIVGTQLLQDIFYLCRLLSDVKLQDLRKSAITSPRASSQSQHISIATWSTQQLSQVETIFRSLLALPPLSAEVDDHDLRRSMIVKDHCRLVHLIRKSAKGNPFKLCSSMFRTSTLH